MTDDDLIGRLAVNRHGARLEAIERINQLAAERDDLQAALRRASRSQIEMVRNAQEWAGSDAVWMERAQKAEADLAAHRTALGTVMAERSAFERDLVAAQATIARINDYAENSVGSWRTAVDLLAILNRSDT